MSFLTRKVTLHVYLKHFYAFYPNPEVFGFVYWPLFLPSKIAFQVSFDMVTILRCQLYALQWCNNLVFPCAMQICPETTLTRTTTHMFVSHQDQVDLCFDFNRFVLLIPRLFSSWWEYWKKLWRKFKALVCRILDSLCLLYLNTLNLI